MGRLPKYPQQFYDDLIELDMEELKQKYPDQDRNKLRALKSHHLRKKAKMEQDPTGRLAKSWQVAMRGADGEWDITTLSSYEHTPDPSELGEVFEPVEPARITPTKRKRAQRLGRQILVFGDSQIGYRRVYDSDGNDELIPTHSEEALDVIRQLNAELRPDEIVNLSDTVDLANEGFTRFAPDSDNFHRTLSPTFRRAHDLMAQFIADNPGVKITEVDSNHTQRVHKAILKNMPSLYGFTLPGEDYPLLSYYRLANLGVLGINFISGYGSAEYVYGEEYDAPPIVFKHGNHSSSTPGSTVRKELTQNPETHIVRGHGHSHEHITTTNRRGQPLHYIQMGTTCATDGRVPSYRNSVSDFGQPVTRQGLERGWVNQAMYITDNQDGTYVFEVIDIINGVAHYKDQRYEGEDRYRINE